MSAHGRDKGRWGNRFGFILAATGSAVGLGNIWRFPYLVGKNGGAVFLLVYLLIVFFVGLPILLAELSVGRAARKAPVAIFRALRAHPAWSAIGWLGTITGGFLILSYYNVIGGWTIRYVIASMGSLMDAASTAAGSAAFFGAFVGNSGHVVFYQILFMGIVMLIVSGGIEKGIERACKVMMPLLFGILLLLILRSATLPNVWAGFEFYLKPDWSRLSDPGLYLDALGQAFYSLSLGLGIMLTYGSYIGKDERIPSAGVWTAGLDTLVAFLAGLAIVPAVFVMGFKPDAGPSLTFITLPAVFARTPAGMYVSFAFFLFLFFAAVTSAISLFEVAVAFAVERFGLRRPAAIGLMGLIVLLLGGYSALSLSGQPKIEFFGKSKDFLDAMDYLGNDILLPSGAFLLSIFVGWVWLPQALGELTNGGTLAFVWEKAWIWSIRFIAPLAIALIFINSLLW
ncbi:MAG: sodium-dependent transporter [Candidatus Accumulibacter sp.]|jgi:NSS family neurotransmitter:Na+ symporter|nr:sodium-dependent transporter [Accumulibacter sp.]